MNSAPPQETYSWYQQLNKPFFAPASWVFGAAWSILYQFNLQNNLLVAVDISLVIITLLWAIKTVYPFSKTVAYFQIPYLLWGLFATLLQFSITVLN